MHAVRLRRSPQPWWAHPYALVALLTLEVWSPALPLGHTTISLAKLWLCVLLAAQAARFWRFRRIQRLRVASPAVRALLLSLLALVVATLLTIVHAQYRGEVIRESAKALEYTGVAFLGLQMQWGLREYRRFFVGLAWLSISIAVAAILDEYLGAHSVFRVGVRLVTRIAGPLEGPNQLATYLGLGIPLLMASLAQKRVIMPSIALILSWIALFLTFSRGGIGAALAATIALGIIMATLPSRPPHLHRVLTTSAIGIVAGLLGALAAAGPGFLHLATVADEGDTGSVGHRSQLWHAAIEFWHRSPWLGIGAGNFERELGQVGLPQLHTHANSLYLQSLAEGGLVLFVVTLDTVIVPLVLCWQQRQRLLLGRVVCIAGLALAAHQIVDTLVFYPKIGTLWWLLVGIALAPWHYQAVAVHHSPKDPPGASFHHTTPVT